MQFLERSDPHLRTWHAVQRELAKFNRFDKKVQANGSNFAAEGMQVSGIDSKWQN